MGKRRKVPVTMRALIQRINRKLAPNQKLKKCRHPSLETTTRPGEFYVVDMRRNFVIDLDADPEKMGRELGVLEPWEAVVDE